MRIYLIKRGKFWHMKWSINGREYRKTTGERTKAKASDVRTELRDRLIAESKIAKFGVEGFRDRYEMEFLAGKSKSHINKFCGAINKLIELEAPELIGDIDSQMIARYAEKMRKAQIANATIASYLGYLDRALKWAVTAGLIAKAPMVEIPDAIDESAAKGRPLIGEEIERMKMQAVAAVGEKAKPSFDRLIDGLNLSGLRLGEAMLLSWPTRDMDSSKIIVQVGAAVTLSIPARSQKRKRREAHPVTPDFAKFLLSVPAHERVGMVFSPLKRKGQRHHRVDTVSKRLSDMGLRAGIVVKSDPDTGKIVYASAHDLRRTFGLRWAKRLLPQELKRIMRHRTIETTLKYYATEDAEALSSELSKRFEVVPNPDYRDSIVKEQKT